MFGLIYVEVNAGVLAASAATALKIAGAVAFAGLLALLAVKRGSGAPAAAAARGGFGRRYWLVVAAEGLFPVPDGLVLLAYGMACGGDAVVRAGLLVTLAGPGSRTEGAGMATAGARGVTGGEENLSQGVEGDGLASSANVSPFRR